MKNILFFLFLLLTVVSCKSSGTPSPESSLLHGTKYARLFVIEDLEDYKIIRIKNPKTLQVERSYALVPYNRSIQVPDGMSIIEVPVKRMAALSTSFVGMLDALKRISVIKATTEEQYVYNKELIQGIQNNEVLTSSYETTLSPEAILKAKIPLIMYSGFGQPFPNEDKLKQLGVVCMANYDWEETHPLGKAEWIKLFGALVGREAEAEAYFSQVEESYLEIKERSMKGKSTYQVICGAMAGDLWYAPSGESFIAGIMKDAGMNYVYGQTKGTASIPLTLEQVFKDEKKCAIWINAEATTLSQLKKMNPKFPHFHTVNQGKVYSYLHDSNYYWEYATVNPHWLLEDFSKIASGKDTENLHFYRQLK